jgi:hypothetical protein
MGEKHFKLNKLDFAISWGLIAGGVVFIISMLSLMGYLGRFQLTTLIFRDLYGTMGYDLTLWGSILGAIYAFIDAFILAFIFAWIYNKLLNRKG